MPGTTRRGQGAAHWVGRDSAMHHHSICGVVTARRISLTSRGALVLGVLREDIAGGLALGIDAATDADATAVSALPGEAALNSASVAVVAAPANSTCAIRTCLRRASAVSI